MGGNFATFVCRACGCTDKFSEKFACLQTCDKFHICGDCKWKWSAVNDALTAMYDRVHFAR